MYLVEHKQRGRKFREHDLPPAPSECVTQDLMRSTNAKRETHLPRKVFQLSRDVLLMNAPAKIVIALIQAVE